MLDTEGGMAPAATDTAQSRNFNLASASTAETPQGTTFRAGARECPHPEEGGTLDY
jgi:hypothetical protein